MPAWSNPLALLLLGLIPLHLLLARRQRRALPLPRSAELTASSSVVAALPQVLRVAVLTVLVFALARPATTVAIAGERSEGIPIVLAIDISSSMLARDFGEQDRLGFARATLSRFIDAREGDPLGLVAFAAEALTLVPPTTHRPVLHNAIDGLQVGLLRDGTAIGDGLAAAINRLRDRDAGDAVIVLLSDGESNRGSVDPLEAAAAAASLGITVHTVGIGSEGVASVPVDAAPAGFQYSEQPVGLDEPLLQDIAAATGGNYYRAADPDALERIYAQIDALVPSTSQVTPYEERREWTPILLLTAAALLLAEWGVRGSRWGAVP